MRMRVSGLLVMGLLVGGCRSETAPVVQAEPPQPPAVFVGTATELIAVDARSGAIRFRAPGAVASPDWSRLWRATVDHTGTSITAVDIDTGVAEASVAVPGIALDVRVVSSDGRQAALAPAGTVIHWPQIAAPRPTTTLAIATMAGAEAPLTVDRFELAGNYEPEAFFADGSLAVVEFVPPDAPMAYSIRRFDPSSGTVVDIPSDEDEAMAGKARTHAYSPDGTRLYTFYTVGEGSSQPHSFIHVLDLEDPSAHCVDLPAPFGSSGASDAVGLALSADGESLFVADPLAGAVAEIDTATLTVGRTGDIGVHEYLGPVSTAMSAGTVYLGSGNTVTAIDTSTLQAAGSWTILGAISALGAAPEEDGSLLLGLADRVTVVDSRTGQELWVLTRTGVEPVTFLGPASPPMPSILTYYECAC
jgi:hypothetical protein